MVHLSLTKTPRRSTTFSALCTCRGEVLDLAFPSVAPATQLLNGRIKSVMYSSVTGLCLEVDRYAAGHLGLAPLHSLEALTARMRVCSSHCQLLIGLPSL